MGGNEFSGLRNVISEWSLATLLLDGWSIKLGYS